MNKIIIKQSLLVLSLALFGTSCSDKFGDDLRDLGSRVEVLEDNVDRLKTFNKNIDILQAILTITQKNGYISSLEDNGDGSYTMIMTYIDDNGNKQNKEFTLCNGEDATSVISVKQDTDGQWYWTVKNDDGTFGWLYVNGEKVRAGAQDGIAPRVRIVTNAEGKRVWQVSTDGGKTWNNLGVCADGVDGEEPYFDYVRISSDGTMLLIKLKGSDQVIRIPINHD